MSRPANLILPPEWAPHDATWLAWPHNRSDWPGKLGAVRWAYGEIVRAIAPAEPVRILTQSDRIERQARGVLRRAGVDLARTRMFRVPTDRGWVRDTGPIFLRRGRGGLTVADFRFNAWAKYPNWRRDDRVARRVAKQLGLPVVTPKVGARRFVLEGGAVDVNGAGAVLTTEECLLDPRVQVRNPGLGRREVASALRTWLGAAAVIWLGRGVAGDDTHGHIDDVCRFVSADTVVLCREPRGDDVNHRVLEANRERLESARLPGGRRLSIVRLPMPAPLHFAGRRLPASYANFYFTNAAVLVPTFNDPADREAMGILAELIPDRRVVGIHSVDLAWGLGAVHCLTQQQPPENTAPGPKIASTAAAGFV